MSGRRSRSLKTWECVRGHFSYLQKPQGNYFSYGWFAAARSRLLCFLEHRGSPASPGLRLFEPARASVDLHHKPAVFLAPPPFSKMPSVGSFEYSQGDLLGHGAFALVFKGKRKKVGRVGLAMLFGWVLCFVVL